jgi:hypothetical protein
VLQQTESVGWLAGWLAGQSFFFFKTAGGSVAQSVCCLLFSFVLLGCAFE